jgi:hypothetical protein
LKSRPNILGEEKVNLPVKEFKGLMPRIMKIPAKDWTRVLEELEHHGVAEYKQGNKMLTIKRNAALP